MEPFFFGEPGEHLYRVYHSPEPRNDTKTGLVLCNAFGQEYMRSHRALRQLATQLAGAGFHVLRFDYRGTGDSSLHLAQVDIDMWIEDACHAVQHHKTLADIDCTGILGLRMGGLVASVACARASDLDFLILWDSVVSGAAYLDELRHQISISAYPGSNFTESDGTLHINGFAMAPAFCRTLKTLSLPDIRPQVARVGIFNSSSGSQAPQLAVAWSGIPDIDVRTIDSPGDWNYTSGDGAILIPQPMLQAIQGWMQEQVSQ